MAGAPSIVAFAACVFSHAPAAAQPTAAVRAEVAVAGAANDPARIAPAISDRLLVVADRDDDDLDGRADGAAESVAPAARTDLVALDARYVGATLTPVSGRDRARLVVGGKPLAWGERVPA